MFASVKFPCDFAHVPQRLGVITEPTLRYLYFNLPLLDIKSNYFRRKMQFIYVVEMTALFSHLTNPNLMLQIKDGVKFYVFVLSLYELEFDEKRH